MGLEKELGLKKQFESVPHEALLNIYYTASQIKKRAATFFREYGLTDVQFNLMMLLQDHPDETTGGLTQVELSRMLLVNRANVTSLIDRMEKAKLVARSSVAGDRRYNVVRLTSHGSKLLSKVRGHYDREVGRIMGGLEQPQQKELVRFLERVRGRINQK